MDLYHKARHLDLLNWIQSQSPNPWPTYDSYKIGKIMRRIHNARVKNSFDFCPNVQCDEVKPIVKEAFCPMVVYEEWMPTVVKWDSKMPNDMG